MKLIAFYLPQFHTIPENDKWWGEGFTDWVNVRKAHPYFEGHYQPRIPLHNNYYNLLDKDVLGWQVNMAKKYGIYGFCMYHYWFNGHKLLEKPMEQFLINKNLHLHFCICWANENWTNAWKSDENKILIKQKYGGEKEWEEHFKYLLPFFQDDRYIKENNCPILVIYRPDIIGCKEKMLNCWNKLAIKNGFAGLVIASQFSGANVYEQEDRQIKYVIEYQPNYASRWLKGNVYLYFKKKKEKLCKKLDKIFYTSKFSTLYFTKKLEIRDYDKFWESILNHQPFNEKCIPGAFVDWDSTPRKGKRGSACLGATPQKFEKYMEKLIVKTKKDYKKDYIFIFAWNEWAEGGYLEPDQKYGYQYLEAIKNSLLNTNEYIN